MKIVYLVGGDRRSPEQRQSYVREGASLRSSRTPILPLHRAVVRCGAPKCDPISSIVRAESCKGAAPGDSALEMVDMRRFEVCAGRLIVAAILVQPRNWVRVSAPVCSHRLLVTQYMVCRGDCQRQQRQCT